MLEFLLNRPKSPAHWQKIPWHDPDFSQRMLQEHLNQAHDLASRRSETIDQHISWIHAAILQNQPARILDLGCGPGFYTHRLSQLGHTCLGIDFSPASIAYAKAHHDGDFQQADILTCDYEGEFNLVMLIYGELNAFSRESARLIINKAYATLKPGGSLLLEVTRLSAIQRYAEQTPTWYTSQSGLFSEKPHLCLSESFLEKDCQITHYYVFAEDNTTPQRYTTMHQGYSEDDYRMMLERFKAIDFYPSLAGEDETGDLFVIVARK